MAASILRYDLKGKARTRPDIFRLVLGPCAPVTEMQQDRTDMPSHLLSSEKKKFKILSQK